MLVPTLLSTKKASSPIELSFQFNWMSLPLNVEVTLEGGVGVFPVVAEEVFEYNEFPIALTALTL